MSKTKLLLGDNIQSLQKLPDNSVDSIVSDPPYGLSFMGKKWDYDVPTVEFWREVYRVLKPGGHVLSFGGTRTYHRMVVNIEDAGFEIRDQIMWLYGSGFPKSHNIGKAVDKFGGNNLLSNEIGTQLKEARTKRGLTLKAADELFCNGTSNYNWLEGRSDGQRIPNQELFDKIVAEWDELKEIRDKVLETEREILGTEITNKTVMSRIGEENESGEYVRTKGQSPYEGWGTALKPANEPICVARKPLSEKSVAENVLKWGTGGINIDGCRVGTEVRTTPVGSDDDRNDETLFGLNRTTHHERVETTEGRFPANIILDEIAGELLDEQSGIVNQGHWPKGSVKGFGDFGGGSSSYEGVGPKDKTKSGASRFFYQAKVSKAERNMGLDEFEETTTGGKGHGLDRRCSNCNTSMLKPEDCKCEEPDWITPPKKNTHPTVKPVSLMAYLCRLVTPPNGIVLDPFMGSGSTGIAARLEGFKFCGMEMDKDYFKIAEARIENFEEYRKFIK